MNSFRVFLAALLWALAAAFAVPAAAADDASAPPPGEVPPCGCSVPPAVPGGGDGNARC